MNNNKGKTVLLVDDDVFFASLVEDELKEEDFEVYTANKINEAKKIIDSNPIDIVILDVMLPIFEEDGLIGQEDGITIKDGRRSGLFLAKWIKRNHPNVFFFAYSNSSSEEVIDWFHKNGRKFFSKIRVKPYDVVKYVCKVTGKTPHDSPKCFIVHGHDENLENQLKNYLQKNLGLPKPIILREQPSLGRTIIEKFEDASKEVDLVFILLTPDDRVYNSKTSKFRPRQNVIFEMGYFLGKFSRKSGRVILLHKGEVELPSDLSGLASINISNGIEAAGEEIRREVAEFLPPKFQK